MFEKYICPEAENGNCKKACSHSDPHEFDEEYCKDVCSEANTYIVCVPYNP